MHRPPRRSAHGTARPAATGRLALLAALLAAAGLSSGTAHAGPRERARHMHDRLVGIPPAPAVLDRMAALIAGGDPLAAAYEAMADPVFYNTALVDFVTPWTNEARTVFADLNDYSATVVGMIRDDVPFDQVLSADLVYVGAPGVVDAPYSHSDNDHYRELVRRGVDLSDPSLLVPVRQSELPEAVIPAEATAGVLTTRAAGEAFLRAGTNRRMIRFTAINFLCRDLESLKDISRPTDRIRQDVTRAPGGDSSVFLNQCSGCHSGMDPLAQAFAYFDFDAESERVVYTPGQVQPKYLINAFTFPLGFVTTDDRWDNYWRHGPNAALGWGEGPGGGFGPKSLGREIAGSRAFSVCQVEKVFAQICLRPPGSQADRDEIERIADVFEENAHSMKRVFAEVAAFCTAD